MVTKPVNRIQVSIGDAEKGLDEYLKTSLNQLLSELLSTILPTLEEMLKKRWVFMENKKVYYDHKVVALLPDLEVYQCEYTSESHPDRINRKKFLFEGLNWDFMTLEESRKCFDKNDGFPFKVEPYYIQYALDKSIEYIAYKTDKGLIKGRDIQYDNTGPYPAIVIPILRLGDENSGKVDYSKAIFLWIKKGLIPKGLSDKQRIAYRELVKLYQAGYLGYFDDIKAVWYKKLVDILNGTFTGKIYGKRFDRNQIFEKVKSGKLELPLVNQAPIIARLLNGDKYRADIESYDEKILTDPNRGHWELWDCPQANTVAVSLQSELIARDPRADIREDGVVAIDFGTKSTVVVYQDNFDHTMPMRVGTGQLSKKIEAKHYENPTVMEFIDLDSFMTAYRAKEGRPYTSWEHLTISHTAFNSLINSSSDQFYTIFYDLKQWAGSKKKQIRLRDKKGKDLVLPPFLEIKNNEINPLEIYAYYLGLYINNLHRGIYLDYLLSVPVNYEKEERLRIAKSFEIGLRKSLPAQILQDTELMESFRVSVGASEPAAYAICALQEYGFRPQNNDAVFYGVFDFGGGTTDFDFGIWREATLQERRYDYVIEHFGAGGDKYLGGENLLELLAFQVFKENQDKLREAKISFVLPPECLPFPGGEILVNDSQEAKLNMKHLMEKLRPLWEKHEDYQKQFEKGVLKVDLFNNGGLAKPNFELVVNKEGLEEFICNRIEKGVRNFFDAMSYSFKNLEDSEIKVNRINIFLAGNSSKSAVVLDLFEQYIQKEVESRSIRHEFFDIFPPLGTPEACKRQEEKGIKSPMDSIEKPTGKTGVAFGLIHSRRGGKIKVIDRNTIDSEIKFKYYLGMSKRGKFLSLIHRDDPYRKWHAFIDASEEDFEIYYSDLAEATNGQMDIKLARRKKCKIDCVQGNANVYIRTVSPTEIEYVVATERGIEKEKYISKVKGLCLE